LIPESFTLSLSENFRQTKKLTAITEFIERFDAEDVDFAVRARRAGGKLIASARMHESRFLTQFISAAASARYVSAVTLLFLLNACKTSQPETAAPFHFALQKRQNLHKSIHHFVKIESAENKKTTKMQK
jgi:hypothetical protein